MLRQYYLIAIVMIFLAVLFFLWSFEKRKPQTREIVMLAVLTAMAIVGRLIFFMTPQFKPCAAVIIICLLYTSHGIAGIRKIPETG